MLNWQNGYVNFRMNRSCAQTCPFLNIFEYCSIIILKTIETVLRYDMNGIFASNALLH